MTAFLAELAEHWDDGYWWADHQLAQAVLVGVIGLLFTAAQLALQHHFRAPAAG
jgi:hypothetical protein